MQRLILLCIFAISAALAAMSGSFAAELALFNDFKRTFNRVYSPAEEVSRLECFRQNLRLIDQRNAKGHARHGLNEFTDLCPDEFKLRTGLFSRPLLKSAPSNNTNPKLPSGAIDWREKGAVTHVKNQGMCGSCWSFSATGNMEGQHFMKTGKLLSLSEEELVGCSSAMGNLGCNGGLMDNAFQWVIKNGGIDTEDDYPYKSGLGFSPACVKAKLSKKAATFTSYVDLPNDEEKMAEWVLKNGPLSIAVDASSGWQTYSGGIVKDCSGTTLDHGVLVVGYGTDHDTPYWIVKNSWGATWGENGYIRLEFGTNQCGLDQMPSSIIA